MSDFNRCSIMLIVSFFFFFQASDSISYDAWRRQDMVEIAGYGEDKLSTVIVTGTLLCQPCLPGLDEWPVSGASIIVRCHSRENDKSSWTRAVTDEYGDFLVDLPSNLHGIPHLERLCTVKVMRLNKNSQCQPIHLKKQKRLKLSSFGNGIRNYTTGKIRLQHLTSQTCIKQKST